MLSIALVVAIPAGILRAGCVGDTCKERAVRDSAQAPFCSLPRLLRDEIAAGFREGRSPEILGVAAKSGLTGPVGPRWRDASGDRTVAWPAMRSASGPVPAGVALAMGGAGISQGGIPAGATLVDVAPTIAEAIGLVRPHPEVRTGSAWSDLVNGEPPSLVLEIVWKGAGGEAWATAPFSEVAAVGAGHERLILGSQPADPAALLATLGSGALPSEHGITGTYTRAEDGSLVEAWTDRALGSVVAMLADDLDEQSPASTTALIGDAPGDLGLVGSDWYLSGDKDRVMLEAGAGPADQARKAKELLRRIGQGSRPDGMADLLAVTLHGSTAEMESATEVIMKAAGKLAPDDVLFVLASLPGEDRPDEGAGSSSMVATEIESALGAPVVEAVAGGGFFLDQSVIANEGIAEDAILAAMDDVRAPDGAKLLADRFSGAAVTFARYC